MLVEDPLDPVQDVLNLDRTRRIEMDLNNNQLRVFGSDNNNDLITPNVAMLPIRGPFTAAPAERRSLGLSDPAGGYAGILSGPDNPGESLLIDRGLDSDGPFFVNAAGDRATADISADRQRQGEFPTGFFEEDGLHNSVFVVLLQRLANPLEAWNADSQSLSDD